MPCSYCERPRSAPSAALSRCFRCQSFGHVQATFLKETRCGICSQPHLTELCLALLKSGVQVAARCANCGLRHHRWNRHCPVFRQLRLSRATAPASLSRDSLTEIMLGFSEGLATLMSTSIPAHLLKQLVDRSVRKDSAPIPPPPERKSPSKLLPRPLLQQKGLAQEAPCGMPPATVPKPTPRASLFSGGSPPGKRKKLNTSGTQTAAEGRAEVGECTGDSLTRHEVGTNTTAPPAKKEIYVQTPRTNTKDSDSNTSMILKKDSHSNTLMILKKDSSSSAKTIRKKDKGINTVKDEFLLCRRLCIDDPTNTKRKTSNQQNQKTAVLFQDQE